MILNIRVQAMKQQVKTVATTATSTCLHRRRKCTKHDPEHNHQFLKRNDDDDRRLCALIFPLFSPLFFLSSLGQGTKGDGCQGGRTWLLGLGRYKQKKTPSILISNGSDRRHLKKLIQTPNKANQQSIGIVLTIFMHLRSPIISRTHHIRILNMVWFLGYYILSPLKEFLLEFSHFYKSRHSPTVKLDQTP